MSKISSQPHTLVKAIRKFFPGQFFSHMKTSKRTKLWLPQRIVFFALLMMWDAERPLEARFASGAVSQLRLLCGFFRLLLGFSRVSPDFCLAQTVQHTSISLIPNGRVAC